MPVLVVGAGAGDEPLLERMEPRLLEVIPGRCGQPTRARLRGGRPVWHDVDATAEFVRRLGGNADYTMHPEETAGNVMLLISGRSAPNPALLERMHAELSR